MTRPHPLGVAWHPEWDKAEKRQAALRVADRKRRIVRRKPPLIDRLAQWLREFVS